MNLQTQRLAADILAERLAMERLIERGRQKFFGARRHARRHGHIFQFKLQPGEQR